VTLRIGLTLRHSDVCFYRVILQNNLISFSAFKQRLFAGIKQDYYYAVMDGGGARSSSGGGV